MLNFDFSASDARQLGVLEAGPREQRRRVLGGVTGLDDVDVLPVLYTTEESRKTKELLLMTCLSLMRLDGLRPIGCNTDNLAADFNMVVSVLEATQAPNTVVVYENCPMETEVNEHVEAGQIVVSCRDSRIYGFEAGQDGLHVYKRLVTSINLTSVEAAWGIRCLRKMLGSWSPLTRGGDLAHEHEDERDETEYAGGNIPTADMHGDGARASSRRTGKKATAHGHRARSRSSLREVLAAYFQGWDLPEDAFVVLSGGAGKVWRHPKHGLCVPPCAKAVILHDAARYTAMRDRPQRECAASAYKLAYPDLPTVPSIRKDLRGLAKLLGIP